MVIITIIKCWKTLRSEIILDNQTRSKIPIAERCGIQTFGLKLNAFLLSSGAISSFSGKDLTGVFKYFEYFMQNLRQILTLCRLKYCLERSCHYCVHIKLIYVPGEMIQLLKCEITNIINCN